MRHDDILRIATAIVLAAGLGGAAQAELGGRVASVTADGVRMAAHMARTTAATHATYTLTPSSGGAVTEYATPDGVVFAVAWAGQARPDLKQLLGSHYDIFRADPANHRGRSMQRRLVVREGNLVVRSAGHPGAFRGVAYLADLVPQGFTADDLR